MHNSTEWFEFIQPEFLSNDATYVFQKTNSEKYKVPENRQNQSKLNSFGSSKRKLGAGYSSTPPLAIRQSARGFSTSPKSVSNFQQNQRASLAPKSRRGDWKASNKSFQTRNRDPSNSTRLFIENHSTETGKVALRLNSEYLRQVALTPIPGEASPELEKLLAKLYELTIQDSKNGVESILKKLERIRKLPDGTLLLQYPKFKAIFKKRNSLSHQVVSRHQAIRKTIPSLVYSQDRIPDSAANGHDDSPTTSASYNRDLKDNGVVALPNLDFLGSKYSLRYGKIVGDQIGLDPVFAAVLNPHGGLVGHGETYASFMDNPGRSITFDPIAMHSGVVTDALNELYVYHEIGEGSGDYSRQLAYSLKRDSQTGMDWWLDLEREEYAIRWLKIAGLKSKKDVNDYPKDVRDNVLHAEVEKALASMRGIEMPDSIRTNQIGFRQLRNSKLLDEHLDKLRNKIPATGSAASNCNIKSDRWPQKPPLNINSKDYLVAQRSLRAVGYSPSSVEVRAFQHYYSEQLNPIEPYDPFESPRPRGILFPAHSYAISSWRREHKKNIFQVFEDVYSAFEIGSDQAKKFIVVDLKRLAYSLPETIWNAFLDSIKDMLKWVLGGAVVGGAILGLIVGYFSGGVLLGPAAAAGAIAGAKLGFWLAMRWFLVQGIIDMVQLSVDFARIFSSGFDIAMRAQGNQRELHRAADIFAQAIRLLLVSLIQAAIEIAIRKKVSKLSKKVKRFKPNSIFGRLVRQAKKRKIKQKQDTIASRQVRAFKQQPVKNSEHAQIIAAYRKRFPNTKLSEAEMIFKLSRGDTINPKTGRFNMNKSVPRKPSRSEAREKFDDNKRRGRLNEIKDNLKELPSKSPRFGDLPEKRKSLLKAFKNAEIGLHHLVQSLGGKVRELPLLGRRIDLAFIRGGKVYLVESKFSGDLARLSQKQLDIDLSYLKTNPRTVVRGELRPLEI